MKVYKFVLDQDVVDNYAEFYFMMHPKARNKPILKPFVPSLNELLVMKRPEMNAVKQKWHEFGIWWINSMGLDGLKLKKVEAETVIYRPSKRRFDLDNAMSTNKLLWDAFTDAGFWEDDDYMHVVKLTASAEYCKEHPRTEFIITVLEE